MIPLDFLKALATDRDVSEAELEVLSLALDGKSTTEISQKLGNRVSPDAVRQRLRSVYKKFNVGSGGHRKLAKLQKILVSQYQEHLVRVSTKKVVILWSGDGKRLAFGLKDTIFQHPRLESWVWDKDIASDKLCLSGIPSDLKNADFVVGCLTRSASTWINFQVGFLLGRFHNFKLVQFNELSGPVAYVQSIDGTDKQELAELLHEMIGGNIQIAQGWVDREFPAWEQILKAAIDNQDEGDLDADIGSVKEAAEGLKENPYVRKNKCFRQLIINSLGEISDQLKTAHSSYSLPAALYPYHLISLQKKLNARVKALAIVDYEEHFWPEEIGRAIGDSAQGESMRVFIFMRPEDFERNFEVLLEHAREYTVRAMSYEKLTRNFPPGFSKDFSIIEASDSSKVLAEYVGRGSLKSIRFSAHDERLQPEVDKVLRHEKVLDAIIESAIPIPKLTEIKEPDQLSQIVDKIRERVFKPSLLTAVGMKPIEMSAYIDIEDYDKHEEKHAYFQEMMERMLGTLEEHRGQKSQPCRVLELGAGTGIFTKRLMAKIPNIEVVAVELDWVCFNRLKHSLQNYRSVKVINEDSCTYEDSSGRFNYVFSSFSDHHIKSEEKEHYFRNIKQNLEPDGLLVVGDEFLPSHEPNNRDARRAALKAYHNHIIEIAQKQGEKVLADLERAALTSGLAEVGDFKVSCEQYETLLSNVGFTFTKQKIGPLERDDVGGVYIYIASLPSTTTRLSSFDPGSA